MTERDFRPWTSPFGVNEIQRLSGAMSKVVSTRIPVRFHPVSLQRRYMPYDPPPEVNSPSKRSSKNASKNAPSELKTVASLSLILCYSLQAISSG